jgi:hypothetical protein
MLKALRCRSSLFAGANIGAFIGRSKFLRNFLLIFYRFSHSQTLAVRVLDENKQNWLPNSHRIKAWGDTMLLCIATCWLLVK